MRLEMLQHRPSKGTFDVSLANDDHDDGEEWMICGAPARVFLTYDSFRIWVLEQSGVLYRSADMEHCPPEYGLTRSWLDEVEHALRAGRAAGPALEVEDVLARGRSSLCECGQNHGVANEEP